MHYKSIAIAVVVAGLLDLTAAAALAAGNGQSVARMLQTIATGPFSDWPYEAGSGGAIIGAGVHFAIMTVMVIGFAFLRPRLGFFRRNRLLPGVAYGAALYLIMYWLILPLRWPDYHPQTGMREIVQPLAIHILLVGLPIAWIVGKPEERSRVANTSLAA